MAIEILLVILLKILMVDIYLAKRLIYLQLLNDGGIGYIIQTVNRSIPLSFQDDIGTAALGTVALRTAVLGNTALGRSLINQPLPLSLLLLLFAAGGLIFLISPFLNSCHLHYPFHKISISSFCTSRYLQLYQYYPVQLRLLVINILIIILQRG